MYTKLRVSVLHKYMYRKKIFISRHFIHFSETLYVRREIFLCTIYLENRKFLWPGLFYRTNRHPPIVTKLFGRNYLDIFYGFQHLERRAIREESYFYINHCMYLLFPWCQYCAKCIPTLCRCGAGIVPSYIKTFTWCKMSSKHQTPAVRNSLCRLVICF